MPPSFTRLLVLRRGEPGIHALVALGMVIGLACGSDPATTSPADPSPPEPPHAIPAQRIIFSSDRTGDFDIYAIAPAGDSLVNLTSEPGQQLHPARSPDRQHIAFVSEFPPEGLRIMNRDGSGVRNLLPELLFPEYPTWSPDGRSLGMRAILGGVSGIWIADVDETDLRQVPALGNEDMPAWAPDGRTIAFHQTNGAIWEVGVDGDGLRQITFPPDGSQDGGAAWSPDGSHLAFHRMDLTVVGDVPQRIFVVQTDGTDLRQVTDFPSGQDWTPAWSPDGTQIVFAHEIGGQFDLYVINADGTDLTRLTASGGIHFRPAW